MYRRKNQKKYCRILVKNAVLMVSLFLLLFSVVGGTIAFLVDTDGPLDNRFTPSKVTTTVEETLEGNVKKNVYIKNTGDTGAWIRAAVVVTWQDKDGNVYGKEPVIDTDYKMELNIPTEISTEPYWIEGNDGFYYWSMPVKSVKEAADNCTTGILINSCEYIANAPDGYYLTVEIIGSGIQSKPADVFNTEWASSGLVVEDKDENDTVLPPENWTLINKEVQG